MKTVVLSTRDPNAIPRAISVIQSGGLVAFPTDTVYGLAAATFSSEALERLFSAKDRDFSKAVAVLVGDIAHLDQLTPGLTASARRLAARFWPGPLTLVVPKHPRLPVNLSPYPTVGLRMPDHPFALELLTSAGPLATTSANYSGSASAVTPDEVLEQLSGRIDLLLDGGACPGGVPSTVVDCTQDPPSVLRSGSITASDIQRALLLSDF